MRNPAPEANQSLDLEQLRLSVRRRGLGTDDFRKINEISEMCRQNLPVSEIKSKVEPLPILSATMMRAASSAEHGAGRVNTLLYALEVLGYKGIKQVCLSSLFGPGSEDVAHLNFVRVPLISKHCLAMGVFARVFSASVEGVDSDEAFTAGLFCYVGYLVWARFMPQMMDRIAATAIHTDCSSLMKLERSALGYDHAEAGRMIAEELRFPEPIQLAMACHHNPSAANEEVQNLAALCHLASFTLDRLDQPAVAGTKPEEFDSEILARLNIRLDGLEEMIQQATGELTTLSAAA